MCGNFIIPSDGWGESTAAPAPNWVPFCQGSTVQGVNADTEQGQAVRTVQAPLCSYLKATQDEENHRLFNSKLTKLLFLP